MQSSTPPTSPEPEPPLPTPSDRVVAGKSLRWASLFTPFYALKVACPVCEKRHALLMYKDEMIRLSNLAGVDSLNARLAALESDFPLVRCAVCVVRRGGERAL